MSAIFGIINLNGEPVNLSFLKGMETAMDYYGPDGKYIWNEGEAGIGQLQSFNTPESVNEKFPLFDSDQNLVFVSSGRIDNRNELFTKLDISKNEQKDFTDSNLIFSAYKKWGREGVNYFLGDWSFAVFNKTKHELFLARDQYGISGIYYYYNKNVFVFSSSLKGILALPFVPQEINELKVAQTLISWAGDGIQTVYTHINRIQPAHYIEVSKASFEKKQYYFLEKAKKVSYNTNEEYIEAFKDILTEAVNCRLRSYGKVGSTLSGGLDSSSISVIAANLLKERNAQLPVFTSVPKYNCQYLMSPKRLADEGELASKVVAFNGNMQHYLIKSEEASVLESIKKALWIHDQPVHAAGNAYWIMDVMGKAAEMGCKSLLTGQCGNATISWPVAAYTNWYNTPKYPVLHFNNFSKWHLAKINILKPATPVILLNMVNRLNAGKNPFYKHAAIHSDFVKKVRLIKEMRKAGFDPSFTSYHDPKTIRFDIIQPIKNTVGHGWHETGSAYGVEVRDPSMDLRVIEFCLSVPDWVYINNNNDRMLLKNILKGIVPQDLLENKKRGLQAADIQFRINEELEKWGGVLNTFVNNKKCNHIVDVQKMMIALKNLNKEEKLDVYKTNMLTRGFMILNWLSQI